MRNYLPYSKKSAVAKIKKLTAGANRHRLQLAVSILILAAGSIFLWAKFAKASFTTSGCNNSYGSSQYEWNNGGFHYVVRMFSTGSNGSAGFGTLYSSEHCPGSSEVVDTSAAPYTWFGVRPVEIRLGVPNQGSANKNGLWDGPTAASSVPFIRPPQYARNWASEAVFTDDAGAAGILSPRFNEKHTIWCWRLESPEVQGDGFQDCAPWGFYNDPVRYPAKDDPGAVGSGFFMSQENCHLSDSGALAGIVFPPGAPTGTDYTHDYTSDGQNQGPAQCSNDVNWLWYNEQATGLSAGGTVASLMNYPAHLLNGTMASCQGAPGVANNCMDLTNYIGCNRANCDHQTQPVDSFTLRQYNRNTIATISGTQTYLTFKYPIPTTVQVIKAPTGCYYPQRAAISTATADGGCGGVLNGYKITLRNVKANWGASGTIPYNGTIKSLAITDTLDANYEIYWGDTACNQSPDGGTARAAPHFQGTAGGTVHWTLTAAEIATLNAGGSEALCFQAHTGSTAAPVTPFNNTVTIDPSSLSVTNNPVIEYDHDITRPFTAQPEVATNFIYNPDLPFLTTLLGDVHAGGTDTNICNVGGSINGASGGGSAGSFVVSAGGSINNFASAGGVNNLGASSYFSVCRPDLVKQAQAYQNSSGKPAQDVFGGLNGFMSDPTYGDNGMLLHVPAGSTPAVIGNVTVNRRVTLWVDGDVIINGNITEAGLHAGGAASQNQLGSFGLIASGNIYIAGASTGNVTNIEGFLYAKGQIITCANGTNRYTNNPLDPNFGTAKLVANCKNPLTLTGLMTAGQVGGSPESFDFNRIANPAVIGSQQSELLTYTGLLFIAPPPVFDQGNTNGKAIPSIEIKPPLY